MISCADPAQLGERTASELSSVGGEQVGEVQQAFSSAANEVLAGTTTGNSISPSVAWIPLLQQNAQPSGQAVAAFTRNDIAYASYSINWFAGTPVWNAASSYDPSPALSWPPPDNLCELYPGLSDCGGTGPSWHAAVRYRHAAKALATGLEGVAAIVATAGDNFNPQGDVTLVTSVDAGVSFTHSLILSIPSLSGVQSGGDIDPESVHASLAYVGESNSPRGGVVGQPIYVTWRTLEGTNRPASWWFTRVVVGASGTAAETMRPRQLSFVPAVASTQASIFGYRLEGHEHIGVAWSERRDETTNCDTDPNATTKIAWYASQTDTFGDEWGCFDGFHSVFPGPFPWLPFAGCDPSEGRTLIAEESEWKKCVWDVQDGRGARNTGRPEVAMNAPMAWGSLDREFDLAKAWYFAVNHRTPTSNGGMRVCLYATGNLGGEVNDHLKNPYCSPDKDPVSNDDIIDAWAPSLAIMQGSGYHFYPAPLLGDPYLLGMVCRASSQIGAGIGARTLATTAEGYTMSFYDDTLSVDGTGVPNTYAGDPGLQLGLMVHQPCELTITGCNGTGSIFAPNVPFLAVWPDTRGTPTGNKIYSRSFVW